MTSSNVRTCSDNYLYISPSKLDGGHGAYVVAHHREANEFKAKKHVWEIEATNSDKVRIKSASSDRSLQGCYLYLSSVVSGETTAGGKATTYYIAAHHNAHVSFEKESLFTIA